MTTRKLIPASLAAAAAAVALMAGCKSSPPAITPHNTSTTTTHMADTANSPLELSVPSELSPGTYTATITPGAEYAAFAVCVDKSCSPAGPAPVIWSDSKPHVVTVPDNAVSVIFTHAVLGGGL